MILSKAYSLNVAAYNDNIAKLVVYPDLASPIGTTHTIHIYLHRAYDPDVVRMSKYILAKRCGKDVINLSR